MTLPLRKKALLSLAVTASTLGAAELGLRLFGFQFMPKEVPLIIWNPEEDKQFDSAQALHRMDAECLWTPQPYAAIPWSPEESVNSESYRGQALKRRPSTQTFRVAFLGDSSTFGWGVELDQTFAAKCATSLSEGGVPTESINAGVIGYTTAQGLRRYRALVRDYKPDAVVLAFGAMNEHHAAPGDVTDREKMLRLEVETTGITSVARWVRINSRVAHLMDSIRFERSGGMESLTERYREHRKDRQKELPRVGQVDFAGVRRVSLNEHRLYMSELVSEIRSDGATPIVLSMPRKLAAEERAPVLRLYTAATESEAAQLGAPLADAHADFRSFEEDSWESIFFIDDCHPKPRGHDLIAQKLVPLLTSIAEERGHTPSAPEED